MFYKVTDKNSEIYKKLKQQREKELGLEEENLKKVKEKVGLEFENFLGHHGQKGFNRVTDFCGFVFKEPEKVDSKIWKKSKEFPEAYVPYKRTKKGREMEEFLDGLPNQGFFKIHDMFEETSNIGRFKIPYMDLVGDVIVLRLDNSINPKQKEVIEITSKEFENLLKSK